jgi:ferrochelatase
MTDSFIDIALLSFGGPERPDLVRPFLERMTGRVPADDVVAAVQQRYAAIGGASPLPEITRRQAAALERRLLEELGFALRVRPGFLYADPDVAACLRELDGREVLALPLSPYSSRLTTQAYRAALDAAGGDAVPLIEGWYADPTFVRVVSERIAQALDGADPEEYALVFTAHSVPLETIRQGDPYAEQVQQTIAQLLPLVQPGDWRLGWQSRGLRGGEWLEPDVEDVVHGLVTDGWRKLLIVPVGFVSDNVETLFDLDVTLRAVIQEAGIPYLRSQAPNDEPSFIAALADIVVDHLARRPVDGLMGGFEADEAGGNGGRPGAAG